MDDKPTFIDAIIVVNDLWMQNTKNQNSANLGRHYAKSFEAGRHSAFKEVMEALTEINTGKRKVADDGDHQRLG